MVIERMTDRPDPNAADARARILRAARSLLEARSAQFFKIREIATMASVSPALVLRYFKSKDELVFSAILANLELRDTPRILALVANNPALTARDYAATLLREDLANGHRTRDLMSMQWWWSSVEEEQYQAAMTPRIALFRLLLLRDLGLPDITDDAVLNGHIHVLVLLYADCLRRAGVLRLNADHAVEKLRLMTAPMLAIIEARAALLLEHDGARV